MKERLLVISGVAGLVVLGVMLRPAAHLYAAWKNDRPVALPLPEVGVDDQSRMHRVAPAEVIPIAASRLDAEAQVAALVRRASAEKRAISIAGARHSMGGHTLSPGGITLDMQPFAEMALDEEKRILRVGAGARWSEVIPYLDGKGMAVAIMQSNNDFSVGGSISVNCHGWQHNSPPIASSVEAIRLVRADGEVVRCSRSENAELFSLALGGYGLFGVILEVDLRVVPNEWYLPQPHQLHPRDYATTYQRLTRGRDDVGMAYGRISVAPTSFLEEATLTLLTRTKPPAQQGPPQRQPLVTSSLPRLVFRGSAGSDYGKDLRWRLETRFGQMEAAPIARNAVMNVPSGWFANRDEGFTEILHEYFIPPSELPKFLESIRPILKESNVDLLNITVRNVEADLDTFLRFAREEVFGLVMLFHQQRSEAADQEMAQLTRRLIDAALAHRGTYYLPYRLHATPEQLQRAYPMTAEFLELKAKYDPEGVFGNEFFRYLTLSVKD